MRYHLKIFTVILVLTAVLAVPAGCGDTEQVEGALEKAAIIDQLYLLEPNSSFISEAAGLLESYGFAVDLWQGSEITVDFYRKLPSMGYKLIIFRVHSGLLVNIQGGAAKAIETTYLFTFENIYPELVATFSPAEGGIINEDTPTIIISYNVPEPLSMPHLTQVR